jgi:CDP-diacylglycerol---glycerol-3-phosphate 3-phosphatidyltransferase
LFDGRWRTSVEQAVKPAGSALRRTGITADHLTAIGLAMAVVTAVAVGSGHLLAGFFLLALASVPDLLDGAVAKASGTASSRGAFFDSVADRVTDSLLFGGVAWYLASTEGGVAPLLPMAVLGTSTLISYDRAKAESLGYTAKGGLMERAERLMALGIGLLFPVLLVPVLWLMLGLTSLTAVQRFVKVWRQASADRPVATTGMRMTPMGERFRAWRATQLAERDWGGARWSVARERRRNANRGQRRRFSGTRRP